MRLSFRTFYKFSFYLAFLIIFILGGMMQFFLGVSNMMLTTLVCGLFLLNYFIYILITKRVIVNSYIIKLFCLGFLILLSGLLNLSNPLKIIIYNIFVICPLSVFLFFYINEKENIISKDRIINLVLFVCYLQFPFLFIQYYFIEYLLPFKLSNQYLSPVDARFGTFFLKSDHSMGFFLLSVIICVIYQVNDFRKKIKYPVLFIIYVSICILFSESGISKGFLILILSSVIVKKLIVKLNKSLVYKLLFGFSVFIAVLIGYQMRHTSYVNKKFGGNMERQLSIKEASKWYERKLASREQIAVIVIKKEPIKWIGGGPYDYYDILKGKFKKTVHFSSIIWSYFDLGILGLILLICILYSMIKKLSLKKLLFYVVFFIIIVYSYYNTLLSDLAILSSIFLIYKTKNEYNSNTFS